MSCINGNGLSNNLLLPLRNRGGDDRLQQIQNLTDNVENNQRKIVEIDKKIEIAENKIKTAENIIVVHERVIKDTEALISNNEALISNNEKIIKTTEELLSCYKSLLANNESQSNITVDSDAPPPTTGQRVILTTAYEKAKQNLIDLNVDLKTNKHLAKVVEKKSTLSTDQFVDDSKTRIAAYNILNDCFNNFRLKYLSSMRWF